MKRDERNSKKERKQSHTLITKKNSKSNKKKKQKEQSGTNRKLFEKMKHHLRNGNEKEAAFRKSPCCRGAKNISCGLGVVRVSTVSPLLCHSEGLSGACVGLRLGRETAGQGVALCLRYWVQPTHVGMCLYVSVSRDK